METERNEYLVQGTEWPAGIYRRHFRVMTPPHASWHFRTLAKFHLGKKSVYLAVQDSLDSLAEELSHDQPLHVSFFKKKTRSGTFEASSQLRLKTFCYRSPGSNVRNNKDNPVSTLRQPKRTSSSVLLSPTGRGPKLT